MPGDTNSGTVQKLIQAGAVGISFALIGLLWAMYQTNVQTVQKITELVEVTRGIGPAVNASINQVAEAKTKEVLAAVASTCNCSRIR